MELIYKVEYLESVIKEDIPKISNVDKKQIKQAIENRLVKDPIHFGKPLRYSLKNCRRMRVGDFRVIFKIEKKLILIVKIGHRKAVYKNI